MKTYCGIREGYAADITVNGRRLKPRLDLWNHSPSGFEWGYGGSGPESSPMRTRRRCFVSCGRSRAARWDASTR